VAHLDHDDEWNENHLEELSNCIETTGAVFICTKANYIHDRVLPTLNSDDKYIDFLPNMAKQIHSSICVNFKKVNVRYIDFFAYKNQMYPSDGILAMDINHFIKTSNLSGENYKSICINSITVNHIEEGVK
jgi:hypothetical protein